MLNPPYEDYDHEKIKEAERRQTHLSLARTQAACGTRHGKGGLRRPPLAGALACRRSTAVLAKGTFVPRAKHRARLPEGGAKAAACRTHRFRSQRCTSRAGRSAGRHDARAARARSVSFRPRAPHSLRLQEVPSPKASFKERDQPPLLPPRWRSQRHLNFCC